MTSTVRLALAALLVLVVLLMAGLLLVEHRPAFLAGLMDPLLGLDHLLALLWLGIWGGRLGGDTMWAAPWAFLVGLLLGFLLATPQSPDPILEGIVHMLGAASILLLVAGGVMVLRLPLRELIGLALLLGGCHGFLHGMENTVAQVASFHIGALISSAALLAVGSVLGLGLTRRTGGP